MKRASIAIAACTGALLVGAPAGYAEKPDPSNGNGSRIAAKACNAEKKADKAAFKAHWGKHAMRECKRTLGGELADEARNAAQECREERDADPAAFAEIRDQRQRQERLRQVRLDQGARGRGHPDVMNAREQHRARAVRARVLIGAVIVAGLWLLLPASALAATADLSVDKSDGPDPVTVGTELAYSVQVANAGPDSASGVELEDELPNQLDFVAAEPSQGSCERKGKKVSCALGSLASGASATVAIRVVPRRDGQIVNTATVSSADTDPQPANNTDTETTTVVAAPPPPTCGGVEATIVGTEGDDALVGTDKRDVIAALAGDDQVRGLGGKDLVCGFGGSDRLKGQGEDDLLRGGGGDDRLGGGGGDDLLRGGTGRDSCRGGPGADVKRSC